MLAATNPTVEKKARRKPVSKEDKSLIAQIVRRAVEEYGDRVKKGKLIKALLAAHRATPIRLDDLLHTCRPDFFHDIFNGVYRHYDPETDAVNFKPQHSEPKRYSWE